MTSQSPAAATANGRFDDTLSDEQIIERVRSGERQLYELIMRRYNQRLYRVARSMLGNDADAEDVLQETYLNAYAHLDSFRGEAKFSTWLTRIAVHEAGRRRRQRARERRSMNDRRIYNSLEPDAKPAKPGPPRSLETAELRNVLTEAIERLPAPLRVIVMLREVEGLSTTETAACTGLSESNVRIRLHRARLLLQAEIDKRLGAEIRQLYQFAGHRCDRIVAKVMARICD